MMGVKTLSISIIALRLPIVIHKVEIKLSFR